MELTAKLVQLLPVQSGTSKSGNEWKRQNIILETEGMYPKKVCVTVWGDRVTEYEPIMQIGSMLTVSYDLESREFNGNWYTDVRAWRVEPAVAGGGDIPQPGAAPQASAPAPNVDFGGDDGDDLPF